MPVLASRFHATEPRGQKGAGYKRMAGNYVYYNRLYQETNPFYHWLADAAVSSFTTQLASLEASTSVTSKAISNLKMMANEELFKEEQFLRHVFSTDININLMNQDQVRSLIDTLNGALQFKETYERNRALIMETKGQKGIFTWFGDYFTKAWNLTIEKSNFAQQISLALEARGGVPMEDVILPIVRKQIDLAIEEAIRIMTTEAKAENGIDQSHKDAYQELYAGLQQFTSTFGALSANLRAIYQLDRIEELIMTQLRDYNNVKDALTLNKGQVVSNATIHSKGGLSLEAFEQAIVSVALQEALAGTGISVKGMNTGRFGVKADNIYTIGTNISISNLLEKTSSSEREANIEAFSELGRQLASMNDGYVIYTNAKNYTLNSDFHGFSAGEDFSLGKLGSILELAGQSTSSAKTIMGIALQLGAGAIGDKSNGKETIERYIALNMAAFLFDDFTSIGESNATGANALHIFDLNGVYVPLSVVLFKLAQAAEQTKSEVDAIVRVNLYAPPILYPEPHTGIGCWNEQRQSAIANTKISIHFLKGLRDLLS